MSAKGDTTNTAASASASAAAAAVPARGGEGAKETKVVESREYRSPAGQAQEEKRPVQVVHEYPAAKSSAGSTKQD